MLHGYSQGHNLLAASIILPYEEDMDLLFTQSDWDEYSSPYDNDSSYLTIYPLKKSGYIVVAKSWYAHEMERPGCVWTQSLLVKMDEIEQEFNFEELLDVFRRPERDKYDMYTLPIQVKSEDFRAAPLVSSISAGNVGGLLKFLSQKKLGVSYRVELPSIEYQKLVLRLIQYLPTEMLRETSICSGTLLQRRINGHPFSLQFTTQTDNLLASSKIDIDDDIFRFWSEYVYDDLRSIFKLIRLFSKDIGDSTEKLKAVISLICLLLQTYQEGKEVKMETILEVILSAFPEKEYGLTVKQNFLRQSVTKLFCTESHFIYLLCTIQMEDAFDYDSIDFHGRVLAYKKMEGIDEYVSLLVDLSKADYLNEEGKSLLTNALDGLAKEEVVALINKDWSLFKSIVTLNNEVLAGDFWLELLPPQFLSLFAIFQKNVPDGFESWDKLYKKLLTIDTFIADNILSEFVGRIEEYVAIALDQWNSNKHVPINWALLHMCIKQHSRVIEWMGNQSAFNDDIRAAVKRSISPDEVIVVKMGSAKWKTFVNEELVSHKDANELVYSYVLAFNWRDYNSLGYIKSILPYIYEALSVEKLSYSSWKRIEPFTGSVPFWRSWDNCRKVLIGVKDYCKVINLNTKDIENFTTNPKLNGELMELWKKG